MIVFSVGDIVYMEDINDPNNRFPVNFRGWNGNDAIVIFDGKQMSMTKDRIFKNDVQKPKEKPVSSEKEGEGKLTDPAEIQKLKNSIAEAEMIIKSGKKIDGTPHDAEYLEKIRKDVIRYKKQIGDESATPEVKKAKIESKRKEEVLELKPANKVEKIEDFGEKIEGARKDQIKKIL